MGIRSGWDDGLVNTAHAGELMSSTVIRSLYFVPGHRPDMIAKAHGHGADITVLDWEDAVAPDLKAEARSRRYLVLPRVAQPRQDVRVASIAFVSMLTWAYVWYSPSGGLSTADLADHFIDLLVQRQQH